MPSSKGIKLGTRVMMGIPTLRSARRSIGWIDSMCNIQMPLGSSLGRLWIEDETIAEARNALCKAAVEQGVEYLFMLGDDVWPPPNVLLTLLHRMGQTYPVAKQVHGEGESVFSTNPEEIELVKCQMATGVYWTKTYPPEPYLFNGLLRGTYRDWKAGELHDVDLAGCDCLLIDTEVLRETPFPWFSTDWVWEPGQEPSSIATEDFYFYTKTRKLGFRLFADTSIQCLHEERSNGATFGLSTDMVQAGGMPEVGLEECLIADVGSGVYTHSSLYGPKAKIVRFDMRPDVNPDVRCDIREIPSQWFDKFDVVSSSHVLEHFRRSEAPDLLQHWLKLLKVGGKLIIHVPNFEHAVTTIMGSGSAEDKTYAWQQIYGDQAQVGAPWEHKNGFTARKLKALLEFGVKGLGDITIEEEDEGLNLKATAIKVDKAEPEALTSIGIGQDNGVDNLSIQST